MVIVLFLNMVIHKTGINCGKENTKINYDEVISEKDNEYESIETNTSQNEEEVNWYIEIPALSLRAPIQETVNLDVLNNNIGHFEETSKKEGNIGLAGHNRGFEKNYFRELNKLKKGEEIKYKYNEFEKTYLIKKIEIIKNTNWSYLENTRENKITLITCIENKPDLRLCIQGIQK